MAYEVLKGAIAASGDKQDIPSLQDGAIANRMSFALGFPQITSEDKNLGGLPPRRADINQAFYLLSNNLYEFQNGAFPTFNTSALAYLPGGVGYPNGAILWCAAEGRFVRSTKADNADNFITTPTYIGTSWVFLNDNEVSDDAVGLLLTNSTTNITVGTGFVKSVTTGRILKLSSSLSVLWTTIQANSSVTGVANTRYNLFLAYNPTNTTYTILCASYGSFTPTLPTGYTDYALIGYMSTDNNNGVNNVFPQEMDLQQWYRSGQVNNDKLTRFSVNSGKVSSDGKGDLISVSGSVVTFKVGGSYPNLVCTPANQLASFSLSTLNNFNTSTLANGTYALCVSKNGVVSAHAYIQGTLTYISNRAPSNPVSGQLWLDTSKEPLMAYQYNSGWIPFNEVPLCVVTVLSGSVTNKYTLPYNRVEGKDIYQPAGSLAFGPVSTMPGYILCDGRQVSRTDYVDLFEAIGTNFGAGNGSTTFNVPDYRGCFLRGLGIDSATNMYTKQAMGAPNITGTFSVVRRGGNNNPGPTGAFTQTIWNANNGSGGGDDYGGTYTLDASRSSSVYGAANEIRPVNFAVNFFIKY